MSNEAKPGCLGFIGDEILPSYRDLMSRKYLDVPLEVRISSMVVELVPVKGGIGGGIVHPPIGRYVMPLIYH